MGRDRSGRRARAAAPCRATRHSWWTTRRRCPRRQRGDWSRSPAPAFPWCCTPVCRPPEWAMRMRRGRTLRLRRRRGRSAGSRNVRVARTPAALVSALRALAVRPDLRARRATTIVPVHRRTKAGDVWFLYNDSTAARPRPLHVRHARGSLGDRPLDRPRHPPGRVHPPRWPGQRRALARAGSHRAAQLRPPPEGSAQHRRHQRGLVACRRRATRPARPARWQPHRPVERRARDTRFGCPGFRRRRVLGPWRLVADTTAPSGDLRLRLRLRRLAAWERVTALRGRAGTGTYTANVRIPRGWLGARRGVLLDRERSAAHCGSG